MNMHASVQTQFSASDSMGCVRELVIVALDLVDELGMPGEIGAHLDHSLQLMLKYIDGGADQAAPVIL